MKLTNKYIAFLIVLVLVFFDQWLKIFVKLNMKIYEQIEIFSWFRINFIENNGMAFGYELGGSIGKLSLTLFRIIAVVFIFIWLKKLIEKKEAKLIIISIILILSGAMGNILDSVFYGVIFNESTTHSLASFLPESGGYAPFLHGKVVDMFYFPLWEGFLPEWIPFFGGEHFIFFEPIFNMADTYVSIGILLMIIHNILFTKKQQ